ncbi:MAG TPA: hypothetical protein DEA96_17785 [Leptospiraceae bacterium]|nr:hypothetical protein [Spirochaetaceae bacterium]HBS06826.1 hypothetical protein [Leptospiraceae bacterium]
MIVTDVPVAMERSLATYRGSYENCRVLQQTHVVHFPFVLPVNEPVIKPIDSGSDTILIKYRTMRWSDIGYTALGFLFGVITDTAVIAECGALAAADTNPQKLGSAMEGNRQVGVFRFRFETGVGSKAISDAPLAGLKERIKNQSDARFLIAVSADCEGDQEENQQLMQERANYAMAMLKNLGVSKSNTEVLYRNLRQCGEDSESRPADRYVYVIVKEG